jgi:hypothetical protein
MAKMVDGTELYGKAIETIHQLRERVSLLEKAFHAYVADGLEASRQGRSLDPPVLGFCLNCGFPVYDSDIGGGGRYHYALRGIMSAAIVCSDPRL